MLLPTPSGSTCCADGAFRRDLPRYYPVPGSLAWLSQVMARCGRRGRRTENNETLVTVTVSHDEQSSQAKLLKPADLVMVLLIRPREAGSRPMPTLTVNEVSAAAR